MTTPLPANRNWYALNAVTPFNGKEETLLVGIPIDRSGMSPHGIHHVSIGEKTDSGYHCSPAAPMGVFRFGDLCDLVDGHTHKIRNVMGDNWEHLYSDVWLLEKVPEQSITVPSY